MWEAINQLLPQETIEHAFGEMVTETPEDRTVPLVVLDCANIGWSYGIDNFSAQGVNIAIQYFQALGVEIQAFIPAAYLRSKPRRMDNISGSAMMMTDEVEALHRLAACSLLSIVPSGDNDDAYILNYARDNNGYVISNDLFHDHLRSIEVDSVRTSMRVWLADHRCGYSFTSRQQFIFNPCSSLRSAIQAYHSGMQQRQCNSTPAAAVDSSYGAVAHSRLTTSNTSNPPLPLQPRVSPQPVQYQQQYPQRHQHSERQYEQQYPQHLHYREQHSHNAGARSAPRQQVVGAHQSIAGSGGTGSISDSSAELQSLISSISDISTRYCIHITGHCIVMYCIIERCHVTQFAT